MEARGFEPGRAKIDHSVYVRVPLIEVSSRWPMDSPLLDKSPHVRMKLPDKREVGSSTLPRPINQNLLNSGTPADLWRNQPLA